MTLAELIAKAQAAIAAGVSPGATVYTEGCDCTGEAEWLVPEDGAVLIARPKGDYRPCECGDPSPIGQPRCACGGWLPDAVQRRF